MHNVYQPLEKQIKSIYQIGWNRVGHKNTLLKKFEWLKLIMAHTTTNLLERKVLYIDKAGACCMFKSCLKVKHKEKWKWKQKQTNNKKIVTSLNYYYL